MKPGSAEGQSISHTHVCTHAHTPPSCLPSRGRCGLVVENVDEGSDYPGWSLLSAEWWLFWAGGGGAWIWRVEQFPQCKYSRCGQNKTAECRRGKRHTQLASGNQEGRDPSRHDHCRASWWVRPGLLCGENLGLNLTRPFPGDALFRASVSSSTECSDNSFLEGGGGGLGSKWPRPKGPFTRLVASSVSEPRCCVMPGLAGL